MWRFGQPLEWDGVRYENGEDGGTDQMNAAKENIVEPIAKYVEDNYGTPDSDGF
jgi:hypothetical protein